MLNVFQWSRWAAMTVVLGAVSSATATLAADPLVSTAWLQDNLNNPKVRIVEVSVEPGQFERGHIPGAVNVVWHSDLVDPVRRDIVSKDGFEKLVSRAGIAPDTTVVLYGDNNNWFAAWGAWIFDVYGVDNVRILDGGRKKWEAEKREFSTKAADVKTTDYKVSKINLDLRARLSDVLPVAEGKSDTKLLDIRSADEYSGKIFAPKGSQELSIRAGHIPGAVNVPWSTAVKSGALRRDRSRNPIMGPVRCGGGRNL